MPSRQWESNRFLVRGHVIRLSTITLATAFPSLVLGSFRSGLATTRKSEQHRTPNRTSLAKPNQITLDTLDGSLPNCTILFNLNHRDYFGRNKFKVLYLALASIFFSSCATFLFDDFDRRYHDAQLRKVLLNLG